MTRKSEDPIPFYRWFHHAEVDIIRHLYAQGLNEQVLGEGVRIWKTGSAIDQENLSNGPWGLKL